MKKTLLSLLAIATLSFANAQNVNIPDANFKAYLVGNASINTNADTEIQVAEASSFAGMIICENLSITDLTGIEAFTSLTILRCGGNGLTSLDISANTSLAGTFRCDNNNQLSSLILPNAPSLTEIYCGNCNISSVDISVVPNITLFHAVDNNFSSLNVSANTALVNLNFGYAPLTSIDLTGLNTLDYIACQGSGLTSLDVSMCPAVTGMYAPNMVDLIELNIANGNNMNWAPGNLSASGLVSLSCVTVDNVAMANIAFAPAFDAGTTFSLDCSQGGTPMASSVDVTAVGGVAEVEVGGTLQMAADVLPANASQMVIWQVQDVTGQATIDQNSGLLTGVTIGTVDVGAFAIDGSNAYGTMTVTVIEAVGIEDLNSEAMQIYPNPATSLLTIDSEYKIESVRIFNLAGSLVQTELNASFSVASLESGIYLLNITTAQGITQKRLVKQ